MVMSNRSVTTIAGIKGSPGTADGTAAQFSYPWDIAVLSNGSLAVTENDNNAVRIVVVAGLKGTAGSADGEYTDARFHYPGGIVTAADGTTLFVADAWGAAVRRIVGRTVIQFLPGFVNMQRDVQIQRGQQLVHEWDSSTDSGSQGCSEVPTLA